MSNQSRVTQAGTYRKGNAPQRGCIWLLMILNIMHKKKTLVHVVDGQGSTPTHTESYKINTADNSVYRAVTSAAASRARSVRYTLSCRTGKVVASHAAVARSSPAEVH